MAGTSSPNDQINVVIVGIRNQGRNHIGYHTAQKNVRIVTLCDIDERLFGERIPMISGGTPKTETDLRRVLDDKNIDCVVFATPNHWHALGTIWACQAGKDVYVEKPATFCIGEGRKMIEAAVKYNRIVQHGTHLRANSGRQQAVKLVREGAIGEPYMARAFTARPRESIGIEQDTAAPQGVDYDLWLGPAPQRAFNSNRFHYNWHWQWDYGNGESGNNGVHVLDMVIDGLNKQETLPNRVGSQGGRYVWNDQGQTPNTQLTTFQYGDGTLVSLEVCNLPYTRVAKGTDGVIFFGSKGYLTLLLDGNFESVVNGKPGPSGSGSGAHVQLLENFYDAVRSRNNEKLLAPIKYGHTAAALCHLGNISYRLGRSLEFAPQSESFPHDAAANAMITREYRKGFAVPDHV